MRAVRALPLLLVLPVACGGDDAKTDDAGDAAREVAISATDALKFDPATVTAKAGEQVTFVVTNTGTTDHEFVVGDEDYQHAHDSDGGHAHGSGDGAAADVPAGKTVRVSFTMPADAPVYACHVNDHDAAGMTGTVQYA
jgi:plastocyanin